MSKTISIKQHNPKYIIFMYSVNNSDCFVNLDLEISISFTRLLFRCIILSMNEVLLTSFTLYRKAIYISIIKDQDCSKQQQKETNKQLHYSTETLSARRNRKRTRGN